MTLLYFNLFVLELKFSNSCTRLTIDFYRMIFLVWIVHYDYYLRMSNNQMEQTIILPRFNKSDQVIVIIAEL
jgi:hypothetical protein